MKRERGRTFGVEAGAKVRPALQFDARAEQVHEAFELGARFHCTQYEHSGIMYEYEYGMINESILTCARGSECCAREN